jgi:endoglucanase
MRKLIITLVVGMQVSAQSSPLWWRGHSWPPRLDSSRRMPHLLAFALPSDPRPEPSRERQGAVSNVNNSSAMAQSSWPLWQNYADRFLDTTGRILDHDAGDRTTSEGQSYALFFSLVANDRPCFNRILSWTEQHLAQGSLRDHLPAWLWENKNGSWQVSDRNSASDADLWLAYTLLEAGRLWHDPSLTEKGSGLARKIAAGEVVDIPELGPMLLPGPTGFHTQDGFYQLNPSYLPVQLLLALEHYQPGGPWGNIASGVPKVLRGAASGGFILDWVAFRPGDGFSPYPSPAPVALASYDAIRVYLWAGMLNENSPYRSKVFDCLQPMSAYMERHAAPPGEVTPSGQIRNASGNVGFSAAVLPLLTSMGLRSSSDRQLRRLNSERNAGTGLFGAKPRYYDQNLALFATGWSEKRFHFDPRGLLQVNWK